MEPKALGRIEPAGEVIDVGATMGDRLIKLTVKEGDVVKEGQPLAYLDSHALRKLEVEATAHELDQAKSRLAAEQALAEARIAAARLRLSEARTRELGIEAQELKIPVLQHNWEVTKKNRERLDGLSVQLVSDQQRELQQWAVERAKAEWEAAEKILKQDQLSVALAVRAAQAELDVALAGKQVAISSIPQQSLEKKLELAKARWERSVLNAPSDGTVLKVFMRQGELVGTIPILQMADLDRMIVIAQVYETDVKRLQRRPKCGRYQQVLSLALRPTGAARQGYPHRKHRLTADFEGSKSVGPDGSASGRCASRVG